MDSQCFDGLSAGELAARLGLPRVELHRTVVTTMDLAHAAAEAGAPAGTLILTEEQRAGRGRGGKRWTSQPGRGLSMTWVERPRSTRGLEVLSLRLGLHAAEALDRFTDGQSVRLKWPNDLILSGGKLGGILVEARWRDGRVDWVAIGVGINVAPPDVDGAVGLADGTRRCDVLEAVLPTMRRAAQVEGPFSAGELARYATRDLCVGRRITEPAQGVVAGVAESGELLVETVAGRVACHAGSLVFAEEA